MYLTLFSNAVSIVSPTVLTYEDGFEDGKTFIRSQLQPILQNLTAAVEGLNSIVNEG